MLQLIATIVLIVSIFGMAWILYRKIPDLKKLSELKKKKPAKNLKLLYSKIGDLDFFRANFFENLLQKTLSKIKISALKIENKCSQVLQKMREKSIEKKKAKKDKYWQRLKKSVAARKKKK